MIGLSSLAFDTNGSIILMRTKHGVLPPLTRRVTQVATLDGNNMITDLGVSESDGAWNIQSFDEGVSIILEGMIKNHAKILLTSKRGAFQGVIKSLDTSSYPIKIVFLAELKKS